MTRLPTFATTDGPAARTPSATRPTARLRRMRGALQLLLARLHMRAGFALLPDATLARACRQFCTPLRRTRRAGQPVLSWAATRQDLPTGGERIATYRWSRDSRAGYVLLMHGWSDASDCFSAWIAPLLQAGLTVIAYDQPAHGNSSGTQADLPRFVSALQAVVDHYGAPRAMSGHSLGGAAVAAALADRMDAGCAVLLSPAADLGHAMGRYTRVLRLPDAFAERMIAAFQAGTVPIDRLRAEALAPKLQARGLIVHDIFDKEVPFIEGECHARYWHGARLMATRYLGHRRLLSDPQVIDEAVAFIAGAPRA